MVTIKTESLVFHTSRHLGQVCPQHLDSEMQSPAASEGCQGSAEGDSNFTTQSKGYEVTGNEWFVNNGSSHFLTMFEVREAPSWQPWPSLCTLWPGLLHTHPHTWPPGHLATCTLWPGLLHTHPHTWHGHGGTQRDGWGLRSQEKAPLLHSLESCWAHRHPQAYCVSAFAPISAQGYSTGICR